jgi:hypothetical protein
MDKVWGSTGVSGGQTGFFLAWSAWDSVWLAVGAVQSIHLKKKIFGEVEIKRSR